MYVCICNAISDRQINSAIAGGANKVGSVYKACGAKPQCGRCSTMIGDMLSRSRQDEGKETHNPSTAKHIG